MTPLERLRIAAALVHVVPGAELRLRTERGDAISVGQRSTADVAACALRRAVTASAAPCQPDLGQRVAEIVVGGSLLDIGGGVFSTLAEGREQRWIATLLPPERVAAIFDGLDLGTVPDEAMDVRLKPDSHLAVTVLVITSHDPACDDSLDDIATDAAAACFVGELDFCSESGVEPAERSARGS